MRFAHHLFGVVDLAGAVGLTLAIMAIGSSCTGPSKRAAAAGLYSLGTGAAVAAQACAGQGSQACRETAIAAGVAVAGMGLAAWATAYLAETSERPAPAPASLATAN